jgi:UDP:flavonoid glycosyltransferase YjiC (YdhE family)
VGGDARWRDRSPGVERVSRIAVVAGPDPGHALPALGVAAALRDRGHELRVLTGAGHDRTAAGLGLVAERLPLLAPSREDDDLSHRLWTRAGQMARPLSDLLRAWEPEVLVVDSLTRAGAFAAQLLDRPWIELVGHHLDDPAPDLPPVGSGRRPARTPWRRADDRRIYRLQRRSLALGDRQAAAVARTLDLRGAAAPVLRLVGTLPRLERPRAHWPPDAHVVGGLAVDPAIPRLEPPPGDEPLVVVTDSTASGVDRSLGALALRALAHLEVRTVVTSRLLAPRSDLRVVVGQGPHGPLLAGAAVAVGFGGAGFVTKAASAGVPMVVVPLQGDQRETAARLRDSGAGRVVSLRRLSPLSLRWAVLRLLMDPTASLAARRLAREAAVLGPGIAAALVEEVLAGRRPLASGPAHHLR